MISGLFQHPAKALFNKHSSEHRFYQMYFRRAEMTNDLKLIFGRI